MNRLYRVISKAADTLTPERQFFRLWAIGAAIGFVLWLPGYTRRLLTARRLAKFQGVRMQHFGQQYKVPGLSVAVTSRVYTPCVIGLWRETVLLPETAYRAKQLEMILQHEYCHIKHHDSLLDFFLQILCTIFWWNPGIHICRFVVTRLCDHRCDREVLRHVRPSARRYYCKTLLTFVSNRPGASGQFAASSLKSRFYLILYSEGEVKRAWVGLVMLLIIALCLFTYLVIFQPVPFPKKQTQIEVKKPNKSKGHAPA